jgi:hypothetical protein
VFAKPTWATLFGSPSRKLLARAVAITATVGAYPHPPRTRRCRVVDVRAAGYAGNELCLCVNLLAVLLLLLI